MMLVFLGLTTNTELDAAPVWQLQGDLPPQEAKAKMSPGETDLIRVLSVQDAALYRAAFAAQEVADWKFADEAMGRIHDKRLIGHVLADRYLRREFSLDEIKGWMAIYSDSPEAAKLYARAKKLKGFGNTYIRAPQTDAAWSGSHGSSSSFGFRSANENDEITAPKARIISKIDTVLRQGDAVKAREHLSAELHRGALSTTEASDVISRVASAFFFDGDIERARSTARMADNSSQALWISGLTAWKQHDFGTAANAFASLAQTKGLSSWDQAAAAYWAYRATSRLGDKKQSYLWLSEAARHPHSFYGAMANNLMGHKAVRPWHMPDLNAKRVALLASTPAGWQALALIQAGRNDIAESELRRLVPNGSREMRATVLALSGRAYMPSLTFQLSGVATNDNGQPFEGALFPVPPWQPKDGFKIDRALLYALIRHESQFNPNAVSSRGACGLMQIMPSTAREISNDNVSANTSRNCPLHLFDPATNLAMGQKYVRVLIDQPLIGDNLLFLLAAYNGGPGNLARWLAGTDRSDPLFFIESLPVRQTRDYIKQVLLQYWMYRSRLSQPETTIAQLAHGEWPRYAGRDSFVKQADAQGIEVTSVR